MIYFSASENGFFIDGINSEFPADAIAISQEHYETLISGQQQNGAVICPDEKGYPFLLTPKIDLVKHNTQKKDWLRIEANAVINNNQWPSKLALGRLSAEEKRKFNLWLDYLDALEVVDTSSVSDITWPTPPEAQAS